MTDAETGEALTFLPMDQRFKLPKGPAWLWNNPKKAKEAQDLEGINYQVLLRNYHCGPRTSTWGQTYHKYVDDKDGWKTAKWCLTEAKKKGYKAILWTVGWVGREQGMKFVEPSFNCAFETTKDVTCPEGFTKTKRKGTWYYIEVLPDGPRPKVDGSIVLKKGGKVTMDSARQALVDAAGVEPGELTVVDLEDHAGGGLLLQYVTSVDIFLEISNQLKDKVSKLATGALGPLIDFPSSPPAAPGTKPGKKGKGKKPAAKKPAAKKPAAKKPKKARSETPNPYDVSDTGEEAEADAEEADADEDAEEGEEEEEADAEEEEVGVVPVEKIQEPKAKSAAKMQEEYVKMRKKARDDRFNHGDDADEDEDADADADAEEDADADADAEEAAEEVADADASEKGGLDAETEEDVEEVADADEIPEAVPDAPAAEPAKRPGKGSAAKKGKGGR